MLLKHLKNYSPNLHPDMTLVSSVIAGGHVISVTIEYKGKTLKLWGSTENNYYITSIEPSTDNWIKITHTRCIDPSRPTPHVRSSNVTSPEHIEFDFPNPLQAFYYQYIDFQKYEN